MVRIQTINTILELVNEYYKYDATGEITLNIKQLNWLLAQEEYFSELEFLGEITSSLYTDLWDFREYLETEYCA